MLVKKKYLFFLGWVVAIFIMPAFTQAATPQELRDKYNTALQTGNKVKILIVPGHDDEYWGTEFGDIRESDITVAIGQYLYNYLKQDPRLDVTITRTQLTGYTQTFKDYFASNRQQILDFIKTSHSTYNSKVQAGAIKLIDNVPHADADPEVALRLYGINKWANEHNIDITIHIHINDEGGRQTGFIGDYEGFTVYVPQNQFTYANTGDALGEALFDELKLRNQISTYPPESKGLVEDQDLIATGAADTVHNAVALIEYGYIYEPQFRNLNIQESVTKNLAYQTFLGIHRFFGDRIAFPNVDPTVKIPTTLTVAAYNTPTNTNSYLPHTWKKDLDRGAENSDVSALQAALAKAGVYTCGIVGTYGPCTEKSVKAFQKKYGIAQTGVVGPATRTQLNTLYGK